MTKRMPTRRQYEIAKAIYHHIISFQKEGIEELMKQIEILKVSDIVELADYDEEAFMAVKRMAYSCAPLISAEQGSLANAVLYEIALRDCVVAYDVPAKMGRKKKTVKIMHENENDDFAPDEEGPNYDDLLKELA